MNGDQERRQRRQFEPPPWEQDAFQRFQRERSELEKEAALEEALAKLDSPGVASKEVAAEEPVSAVEPAKAGDREFPIPASQLEELMAGLREEEPRPAADYGTLANVVTVALGTGGVGFVIWSGILLGKAGPGAGALQIMASLLVMVWGLMMVGFAVLLWRKYNL